MKYCIRALICLVISALYSACAQAQRDGGRTLENAGSVVRSGAQNLWTTPPPEQQRKKNEAGAAAER